MARVNAVRTSVYSIVVNLIRGPRTATEAADAVVGIAPCDSRSEDESWITSSSATRAGRCTGKRAPPPSGESASRACLRRWPRAGKYISQQKQVRLATRTAQFAREAIDLVIRGITGRAKNVADEELEPNESQRKRDRGEACGGLFLPRPLCTLRFAVAEVECVDVDLVHLTKFCGTGVGVREQPREAPDHLVR